jgi:hypothetical protein
MTLAFGQSDCNCKQMILTIDSIAKSRNIENASVKYKSPTSFMDKPTLENSVLSKNQKFYFKGQFLVIGDSYYNVEKLLYFNIKENYIEFFIQIN